MKNSSRALIWVVMVFAAGILFGTALTLIIVRPDRGLSADLTGDPSADVQAPQTDAPPTDASRTDVPQLDAPPRTDASPTDTPRTDAPPPTADRPGTNNRRRDRLTARVMRQLNLDVEQRIAVREILEQSRLRQQQLNRRRQQDLMNIRRQTLNRIRGVLRPEQERRLRQILRRLNQRRRLRN